MEVRRVDIIDSEVMNLKFHEKLDFLMNITGTTNSTLALYASIDASYISRLRRGKRDLAKNENYVEKMAEYFSKNCVQNHKKKALMDAMSISKDAFKNKAKTTEVIKAWLIEEKSEESRTVEKFLSGLSNAHLYKAERIEMNEHSIDSKDGVSVFFGIEGKRDAVLNFLRSVLSKKNPQTILLLSDSDMEWLTGDRLFAEQWANLMLQIINKGNRIKIIHTLSRDLDEMLAAIYKWMPLYMTGAIDPYYYPDKGDCIFKHTLFVAPEAAALSSDSTGNSVNNEIVFLLKDSKIVEAMESKFNNCLDVCKPLMKIFTIKNISEYEKTLMEFEKVSATAIIRPDVLSINTMPDSLMEGIIDRIDSAPNKNLLEYFKTKKKLFMDNLEKNRIVEIIKKPEIKMISEGGVRIGISNIFEEVGAMYSQAEFMHHLENIVYLLKTRENYDVNIVRENKSGMAIYAKEDLGIIVIKTSKPRTIFAITEKNMTASFWNYMDRLAEKSINKKSEVVAELQTVIKALKDDEGC